VILVTGAAGLLGTEVVKELTRRGVSHMGIDIADLDITDKSAVDVFFGLHKPTCVIHCAAYTAVDAAEDNAALCMRVNGEGTENLAAACRKINAAMLYISTDYVFNGRGDIPYETDSPTEPLSVYGKSKLAGEDAVLRHLNKYFIVRISWVFGPAGANFVKTMLRLVETKNEISVVNDQTGSPTYTVDLAILLCDIAQSEKYGMYHATNEGFCSWAEYAEEIFKTAEINCKVNRISSAAYPTKAARPKSSRLSKASLTNAGFNKLPEWKDALKRFLSAGV
jgi:dTDP-4-dehydrorhamnose reductase